MASAKHAQEDPHLIVHCNTANVHMVPRMTQLEDAQAPPALIALTLDRALITIFHSNRHTL